MKDVQCKKCRYLLKDKEGYNWCPNKTDDPDIELIRNCEWYAVKTNADRIRAMTDEELADEILSWFNWLNAVEWDDNRILEWLKQEANK